ncbi:hypothetical protein Pmani_006828 [Petrolisthes manimaculis]|uniref:Uncharacterized protein n=1 Tax=Petrolisthes manimaculis TaxID=1843537 RepID=A0AAE1ULF0_9EUCA|nr:hypothetical protein Pmani_006828 [Petrolisthes manimaculis]
MSSTRFLHYTPGTIAVVEDEPVDDQFPLAKAGDVSSGSNRNIPSMGPVSRNRLHPRQIPNHLPPPSVFHAIPATKPLHPLPYRPLLHQSQSIPSHTSTTIAADENEVTTTCDFISDASVHDKIVFTHNDIKITSNPDVKDLSGGNSRDLDIPSHDTADKLYSKMEDKLITLHLAKATTTHDVEDLGDVNSRDADNPSHDTTGNLCFEMEDKLMTTPLGAKRTTSKSDTKAKPINIKPDTWTQYVKNLSYDLDLSDIPLPGQVSSAKNNNKCPLSLVSPPSSATTTTTSNRFNPTNTNNANNSNTTIATIKNSTTTNTIITNNKNGSSGIDPEARTSEELISKDKSNGECKFKSIDELKVKSKSESIDELKIKSKSESESLYLFQSTSTKYGTQKDRSPNLSSVEDITDSGANGMQAWNTNLELVKINENGEEKSERVEKWLTAEWKGNSLDDCSSMVFQERNGNMSEMQKFEGASEMESKRNDKENSTLLTPFPLIGDSEVLPLRFRMASEYQLSVTTEPVAGSYSPVLLKKGPSQQINFHSEAKYTTKDDIVRKRRREKMEVVGPCSSTSLPKRLSQPISVEAKYNTRDDNQKRKKCIGSEERIEGNVLASSCSSNSLPTSRDQHVSCKVKCNAKDDSVRKRKKYKQSLPNKTLAKEFRIYKCVKLDSLSDTCLLNHDLDPRLAFLNVSTGWLTAFCSVCKIDIHMPGNSVYST